MHRSIQPLAAIALLLGVVFFAFPARAELYAIGREFRPDAEQREGTNPCTGTDGVTASIVFRCDRLHPAAGCTNPSVGKLYAEWQTADGEADADPVLLAEGYYNYKIPYSCSGDGAILFTLGSTARVVDRQGQREPGSPICESGPCWGPFGISASPGGFLVFWPQYRRGLVGRHFDANGQSDTASFLIAESALDSIPSVGNGLLSPDGSVLIPWSLHTESGTAVRAAMLESDGSITPPITVSEFRHVDTPVTIRLGIEQPGRFFATWENQWNQAGWVARRIVSGEVQPTTTTTTTTTMDLDTPVFLPATEIGPTNSGDDTYRTAAPELIGDGEGSWFATWPDQVLTDDGSEFGSKSSHSASDGRQWSPPQTFASEGYDAAYSSSVASDEAGVSLAVRTRSDNAAVLLRRSTDGGATWSEMDPVYAVENPGDPWEEYRSLDSLVVAAGSDGRWVVAWTESFEEYRPCEEDDCVDYESFTVLCAIRTSTSSDGGLTWSSPLDIEDDTCGLYRDLRIASDGNGNWLAAWIDDDIRGAVSTDDGEQWSDSRTLVPDPWLVPATLALAANPEGNWLLAFSQWHTDSTLPWPKGQYARVYVSRSADLTGDWSSPSGVAPWHDKVDGKDLYPSIAVGEDGEFGMAWSSHSADTGLDADIVASFSSDAGLSWSIPRAVDTGAKEDWRRDLSPRMVRAGSTWAVIWRTLEPTSNRTIRFARTRGNCGNGEIDPPEECDDSNLVEGDGCDSTCLFTGCGSQVVTGDEECDDGNLDETDDCVSCVHAFCGDGFVRSASEQCDDADADSGDDCLDICTLARCGDGVVQAGVESCDDGTTSGNNDGCLSVCTVSACGDGYLQIGEEECDDGNAEDGDGCTGECMLDPGCGFFTSKGLRVTATDALKVLRRAVGNTPDCPMRSCDPDQDGKVTAIDALWTLRSAVGLFADGCHLATRIRLHLTSDEKLGSLQITLRTIDAAGHIVAKAVGKPACEVLIPSALSAMNLVEDKGELRAGFISLEGFQGPQDLLVCDYDPVSGPSLHDFHLTVVDASRTDSSTVEPPPIITLTTE